MGLHGLEVLEFSAFYGNHVFFGEDSLDTQLELLNALRSQHPMLRELRFSGGFKWLKDTQTGLWGCKMPGMGG